MTVAGKGEEGSDLSVGGASVRPTEGGGRDVHRVGSSREGWTSTARSAGAMAMAPEVRFLAGQMCRSEERHSALITVPGREYAAAFVLQA